jgi:hypothetical protein
MPRDPKYVFFYEVSKRLRKDLPVGHKVHVRLQHDYGSHGSCQYIEHGPNPRFMIIVRKSGESERDVHVLLHEYAHVLSWFCETAHHGTAWQTAYGRVYRWYEKVILEEEITDDADIEE